VTPRRVQIPDARLAAGTAAVDHRDQGTEMARHLTIAQSLGPPV
jgi:hypothetical protein